MKFFGVNAPLGSGKTTAAVDYAGFLALGGERFVIAQPSIRLINQTVAQFQKRWPLVPVYVINSEICANVSQAIADHTKAATGGQVLFVTHAALTQALYWHDRGAWHLIIDEAPNVVWTKDVCLPTNHAYLMPSLAEVPYNIRYARLAPRDVLSLERMATNANGDDYDRVHAELAAKVISTNWDLYVLAEAFERLQTGHVTDGRMTVFGLLSPSAFTAFATTTLMSANLASTIAYRYFVGQGFVFQPHKAITHKLRFKAHPNGDCLMIHYAVAGQWSKRRRDKAVRDKEGFDTTIGALLIAGALDLFGDESFVWQTNKDLDSADPFAGRGLQLPHVAHGLNQYQHIHRAVVIPALNPSPMLFNFLDEVAHVDADEVRDGVYHEAVYQTAGRISTRNLDDHHSKHVVVADRNAAERLQHLYPGAQIKQLPCAELIPENQKPGPKRKHATDADRKAAYRNNRKAELIRQLDAVNQIGKTNSLIGVYKDSSHQMDITGGSAFASVKCCKPLDQFHGDLSSADFIDFLREMHARNLPKPDAGLWSAATYNGGRSLDTIQAIYGIYMDNDGGALSIDDFAAMFTTLQMIICNTASSTRELPRWRVIIPTTCAMSLDVHTDIVGQIRKSLAARGYYDKHQVEKRARKGLCGQDHGFDPTKFNPAALFYLPVQAAAGPDHSFFHEFSGGKRQPINPYLWINRTILNSQPEPTIIQTVPDDDVSACQGSNKVDEIIADWRGTPTGNGNYAFNQLAWRLNKAGLPLDEVKRVLECEANSARSRGDRRRQIDSVMKGLQRRPKS